MKENILKLKSEGKSNREIANILGCSKSTVTYYVGSNQIEKNRERRKRFRTNNPIGEKLIRFKSKGLSGKCRDFQRRNGSHLENKNEALNFNVEDIINKFGDSPKCYLTGRELNWSETKDYHFDHIMPAAKGGGNTLNNLGILCKDVNLIKHDLTIDELISICKEILIYNGYKITKGE